MRKNILRRATAALLGAAAIALMAPATSASAEDSVATLSSGAKLMPGQTMRSGDSLLVMQGDGNLVLYLQSPTSGARGPALWSSGTWGNWNAYAFMQPDGNLVVYRQGSTAPSDAVWSTGTAGSWGASFSLYRGQMTLWPTMAGGKGWESRTGLAPAIGFGGAYPEAFITSSRNIESGQWIQSKSVWLVNQPDGNLVLYRKRDGAALWSSGTWNHPHGQLVLWNSQWYPLLSLQDRDNGQRIWSSPGKGQDGTYGIVQDDGNFVIYGSSGAALWSTGTWGNW
ncbi:hypothetical protein [Kitasatospora sp. NPDC059673]|uniref:hypothetical protein n=1 Tax=Kitasatospora sp. NPDC059673 TaxID=3346901 RepID=UPI003694E982